MKRSCLAAISVCVLSAPVGATASDADGVVNVRSTGAVGNGRADDTDAIQKSISAGQMVQCHAGDVYAVNGGLVSEIPGQVIDFTGCTVRLKDGAAKKGVLELKGEGSRVIGGTWDLNAAKVGNDADGGFSTWAVLLAANRTSAERLNVKNSNGIGIKAAAGVSFGAVRQCRTEHTRLFGIFFDGSATGDAEGNRIEENEVDFSSNNTGQGIGLYGKSDPGTGVFSHDQRRYVVSRNVVSGPTAGQAGSSVAITVRALGGLVSGNVVRGGDIGISVDRTTPNQSVIIGNHVTGHKSIGIEVNGGDAIVGHNYVEGGANGIEGSIGRAGRNGDSIDNVVVNGNVLVGQTSSAIYFAPGVGFTARYITISDNSIRPAKGARGVYLQRDCRYALIQGNVFRGPGAAVLGSRGIYLDSVNSDILIRGNRFSGWERATAIYNPAHVVQDRIFFEGNDVATDMASSAPRHLVNAEGGASWGAGVETVNNFTGEPSSIEGKITFTVPPIPGHSCAVDLAVPLSGVVTGSPCFLGLPASIPSDIVASCFVGAVGVVHLRLCNAGGTERAPGQGTYSVRVSNP